MQEEGKYADLAEEDFPMLRRMAALKQDTISMSNNLEISNFGYFEVKDEEESS